MDGGDNAALPADTQDLDGDGDTEEPLPHDIAGHARIVDGNGDAAAIVDMGAHEHDVCPADLDGDGWVEIDDLLVVVGTWGTDDPIADLDGDGIVEVDDLLQVIDAWGSCP